MLTYALPVITASLALLYLAKDWEAHKKSWRRALVMTLIIAIGIGGGINNYFQDKRVADQHDKDQKQIGDLKGEIVKLKSAVETGNQDQKDNIKLFGDTLGKYEVYFRNLSREINDLKRTQMSAIEFQKKADQLRADIDAKANQTSQIKQELKPPPPAPPSQIRLIP
jgi:hypothetical protein